MFGQALLWIWMDGRASKARGEKLSEDGAQTIPVD